MDEDRGKASSICSKSIVERLQEEVRDAKIRILSSLKRNSEEERKAWNAFSASLKEEFPNYTPLLTKILEGLIAGGSDEDNVHHNQESNIEGKIGAGCLQMVKRKRGHGERESGSEREEQKIKWEKESMKIHHLDPTEKEKGGNWVI
ncbi:tripeptidyl-peptidase 2-like [Asparagus officinalis]|uniref:tripeptidyl-peptidase 2-like n=1 Tax=Asparagus officinalis TaxID=4686 RepID=UPI00098E40BF|nr:tripeptidyl-peptidase 2-like [Asparagus officinalis]